MNWIKKLFYRNCKVCGTEFRKRKVQLPSLVGFSFCSSECEKRVWDDWARR